MSIFNKWFTDAQTKAFEEFVSKCVEDGVHENFEDYYQFLVACMETFIKENDM